MKTTRAIWLCGAVSIAAAVCLANEKVQVTPNSKKAPAAAMPVQTRAQKRSDPAGHFPILGHLETRDKIVTIQSGPEGLRYLVKTKNGKVLHENLTEQQLKAQAPDIYELIKTSVAGSSRKGGSFMDARVREGSRGNR